MCLALYKARLGAEQTRTSSACFNRELQNHLHSCSSNHMHMHRGETGSTFSGQDLKEEAFSVAGYLEILLSCMC